MIVLDASVVIKALVEDEQGYLAARDLIRDRAVVPEWLFVEVANALATKTRYTVGEAEELLGLIYDIGFEVEKVDRKMLERSMTLAKTHDVAVYDMIYAVLAEKLNLELITADENFAKKTGFDFVKLLEEI